MHPSKTNNNLNNLKLNQVGFDLNSEKLLNPKEQSQLFGSSIKTQNFAKTPYNKQIQFEIMLDNIDEMNLNDYQNGLIDKKYETSRIKTYTVRKRIQETAQEIKDKNQTLPDLIEDKKVRASISKK